MNSDENKRILVAAGIGALVGGLFVAAATNAIPKLIEQMSATMMGKMMQRMQEEGCTADEM